MRGPVLAAAGALLAGAGSAQAGDVVTQWTMPTVAVPEAARPSWPNVFGTVALPVRPRPTGTRWTKLLHAALDQPALQRLAGSAAGLSRQEQVAYVQSAVSRAIPRGGSQQDCSDDGYWAAGSETLARGLGDCFDIAVAKMEALRSLGFADRDLYLTTGYWRAADEPGGRRGTAALLVRVDTGFVLLPDGPGAVVTSAAPAEGATEALPDFSPYITYGYGMTWVHGRMTRQVAVQPGLAPAPVEDGDSMATAFAPWRVR